LIGKIDPESSSGRKYWNSLEKAEVIYFRPRSNKKILTTLLNIPGVKVVGNTEAHLTELILTIEAEKEKQEAICPRCHHKSLRLHQNHTYLIKDLPWNEKLVFIKINRR